MARMFYDRAGHPETIVGGKKPKVDDDKGGPSGKVTLACKTVPRKKMTKKRTAKNYRLKKRGMGAPETGSSQIGQIL